MLRNIPKIIQPELMKAMMEMGHSDYLIIVDANFPGNANTNNLIRVDGVSTTDLLKAILPFFPLDNFIDDPVILMRPRPDEKEPEVWKEYRLLLEKYDLDKAFSNFAFLERLEFYEKSQGAFVIAQTTDETRYANILLQKGVC